MSTQATEDKKNEAVLADDSNATGGAGSGGVNENIKNLSTTGNLIKKSKLTKSKKLELSNAKANSGTNFLIFKVKEAFIYLRKSFTETPIFRHFDPEYHI